MYIYLYNLGFILGVLQKWHLKKPLQHLSTTYCDQNIIVHIAHLDLHDLLCNLKSSASKHNFYTKDLWPQNRVHLSFLCVASWNVHTSSF